MIVVRVIIYVWSEGQLYSDLCQIWFIYIDYVRDIY